MQAPDKLTRVLEHCDRPIILLGASVRAAAQSAAAAGFTTLGIDLFGDRETREACECFHTTSEILQMTDQNLRRLIGSNVPLVVVGGLTGSGKLVSRLRPCTRLLGPDQTTSDRLANPTLLAKIARQSGVGFPECRRFTDDEAGSTTNWLLKTPGSAGGLGVRWARQWAQQRAGRVADEHGADEHGADEHGADEHGVNDRVAGNQDSSDEPYLQRWISGCAYGATFLSDGTQSTLLGVCRSLFTRQQGLPFLYAGSFGPIPIQPSHRDQLAAIARQATEHIGHRGLLNVDFVIDRGGNIWLLEINPRWSGSSEVIERSLRSRAILPTDDSLLSWLCAAHEGMISMVDHQRIAATNDDTTRYLKRILYARRSGQYDRTQIDPQEIQLCAPYLITDLPCHHQTIRQGEPLQTVIIEVANRNESDGDGFQWQKARRIFAQMQKAVV